MECLEVDGFTFLLRGEEDVEMILVWCIKWNAVFFYLLKKRTGWRDVNRTNHHLLLHLHPGC